ncbi:MAG: Lin1244/Lin1753 domain-containing protein, partial [Prevotella sp.]
MTWYKMPSNLLCDERVERLLAEIGAAGFGVYMYIIAEMMRHRNHCMTRDSLLSIKIKGHTKATLMRIVDDYGLFINDGKGHVYSAVDFLCKSSRNAQKEQQVECPNEQRDNAQNEPMDDPQDSNLFATSCESDSIPTPPRALQRREEENKKEITSPKNLLMMVKAHLDKNTEWAESIMMKTGVAPQLRKHWEYAVEIFVQHVISQAKDESVVDEKDARRYFCNFCTGNHTRTILAARLAEYDRSHPELNPYRFEDSG